TYAQQVTRTYNSPAGVTGTGALITSGTYRQGIEVKSSGTNPSTPAIYGCDLNGNNIYDESDDGEWITCNYLRWSDLTAYLDWAALRPMTELEYEKACRGTLNPVINEFAWGNTTYISLSSILTGGQASESSSPANANMHNSGMNGGPVRTGIFATSTSNRSASGASYYGIMDLSGNVWEQVISIANNNCRNFTGLVGDGVLDNSGDSNVTLWPVGTDIGLRGGSFTSSNETARVSDRSSITAGATSRNIDYGGRGVR
ncbi:MAG: SUMF1/EgtB/PvdO family nonheme iron enzyme, partial [Sediminibacterium sp.]